MGSVKDNMQNFAINQALKYIEGNPEENIPKLMSLVDLFTPDGWYQSQRDAIRQAIEEKNNWYQLILRVYELDPGVRRAFFQNFLFNASLKGSATQEEVKARENSHLCVQYALYRLLGCGIRQSAQSQLGDHRLHYPPGQGAGYLHVYLHRW